MISFDIELRSMLAAGNYLKLVDRFSCPRPEFSMRGRSLGFYLLDLRVQSRSICFSGIQFSQIR